MKLIAQLKLKKFWLHLLNIVEMLIQDYNFVDGQGFNPRGHN